MKKLILSEIRNNPKLVGALSSKAIAVTVGDTDVRLFVGGDVRDAGDFSELGTVVSAFCVIIPSATPWSDSRALEIAISTLKAQRSFEIEPGPLAHESLPEPKPATPPTQKVMMIAGDFAGKAAMAEAVAATKAPSVAPSKAPEPVIREPKRSPEPPHVSKRPVLDIVGDRKRAEMRAAVERERRKSLPPPPPPAAPPPAPPKVEKPAVAATQTMPPTSLLVVTFRDEKGERILFSGYPADFQKVHIAGLGKGEIRYVLGGELVNEFDVNIFIDVCQLWDTPRGVTFRQENKHLVKMYPAFRKERKKLREVARPKVENRAPGFESTARRSTVPHPGKNWRW